MNIQAVITGIGAISPAGTGIQPLWRAVRDGIACGSKIRSFDTCQNSSHIAAEVPDFDPLQYGLPATMDRSTQFSIAASRMAVEDSGIIVSDPQRAGVVMGTAIGGVAYMERVFRSSCIRQGASKPDRVWMDDSAADPHVYSAFLAHSVSTKVAEDLGFCGVCSTISTGCTAGIDAIGTAADLIQAGMADVIVTGGTDAPLSPIVLTAFDNISCLTRRNEDPSRASRPFDRDRDGFLLAEGCGALVIESFEQARKRGARIYGAIAGYASTSNSYHMTSLPADGVALADTLHLALQRSRVNSDSVQYINAHGSSTKQNDRNETSAFKSVFGTAAPRIPISSTKSVLGHSLGAASALETIVCMMAMQNRIVPPTANYETPDPDCDLDYVPNIARDARLNVVECNASGFSGIHSSLILVSEGY